MRRALRRVKSRYGANPVHLLLVLSSFALAGYVITLLGPTRLVNTTVWWQSILVWFLGALILHDLVLFPLCALLDRWLHRLRRVSRGSSRPRVSAVNHVRVPALAAALLFVMFFPGIVEQGAADYHAATGQTQDPFLTRWLLITAVLFGGSGLVYAVRLAASGRDLPPTNTPPTSDTPDGKHGPTAPGGSGRTANTNGLRRIACRHHQSH